MERLLLQNVYGNFGRLLREGEGYLKSPRFERYEHPFIKVRLHPQLSRGAALSESGGALVLFGWGHSAIQTVRVITIPEEMLKCFDRDFPSAFGHPPRFFDFEFQPGGELLALVGHELPIRLYSALDGALLTSSDHRGSKLTKESREHRRPTEKRVRLSECGLHR